jgi:hypothetical protein
VAADVAASIPGMAAAGAGAGAGAGGGGWSTLPAMRAARCNFGVVAVPEFQGCVAVLGGEGGRAGATAELFHPGTGQWVMLTAMGVPRSGCGAAALSLVRTTLVPNDSRLSGARLAAGLGGWAHVMTRCGAV